MLSFDSGCCKAVLHRELWNGNGLVRFGGFLPKNLDFYAWATLLCSHAWDKVCDAWLPPEQCVHLPRKPNLGSFLGVVWGLLPAESLLVLDVSLCGRCVADLPPLRHPLASWLCYGRWVTASGDMARRQGSEEQFTQGQLKGAGLKMINNTTCFAHVCLSARLLLKTTALLGNICFAHQEIALCRHSTVFLNLCVCVLIVSCVSSIPHCVAAFQLLCVCRVFMCVFVCVIDVLLTMCVF